MSEQSVKFQLLFPRQPEESRCFHCVKAGQFPKVAPDKVWEGAKGLQPCPLGEAAWEVAPCMI